MEIREVTTYNPDAPFKGYGIWILFEYKYRKVQLLHPVFLTELILSEYEYVKSSGNSLWPINTSGIENSFHWERFKAKFKERVKHFAENQKSFPVQLVAKVIAEMDGVTEKEAVRWIGSFTESVAGKPAPLLFNKANREYALNKDVKLSEYRGRILTILTIFNETGPASIYQITHLAQGRLKTKSDVGRVVTYFVNKLASQGILEIVG